MKINSLKENRNLYTILILNFLSKFAHSCFFCLFSVYLLQKGRTLFEISMIMGTFSLGIMIFEIPTGILSDFFDKKRCVLLSFVLSLFAYCIIFCSINLYFLIVAEIILAIGAAFQSGCLESWVFDVLENDKYKSYFIISEISL